MRGRDRDRDMHMRDGVSDYTRGGGGMGGDVMRNGGRGVTVSHVPMYTSGGGGGRMVDMGTRGSGDFGGSRTVEYGTAYSHDTRGGYSGVASRAERERERERERYEGTIPGIRTTEEITNDPKALSSVPIFLALVPLSPVVDFVIDDQ